MFDILDQSSKNDLLTAIMVSLISSRINDFSEVFTENIILPLINFDIDGDGTKDGRKLIDYQINLNGIKINLGRIIISIIQFCVVLKLINFFKSYLSP
jgi:large-conductance mechanosensitive channel